MTERVNGRILSQIVERNEGCTDSHPLGHSVSLTNSTEITSFCGGVEKHLATTADGAAMVRPRMRC